MRATFVKLGMLFLSLAFGLFLTESGLRFMGYTPFTYRVFPNEPVMNSADDILGWKNKEGRHVVAPYSPEGREIHITFLDDGRRVAAPASAEATNTPSDIILLGGSYTQGWAISDDETFAWKIQENMPKYRVLNYGTPGYGTYQSLLVLEKIIDALNNPKFIIYGFNQHHADRNIGGEWLALLETVSIRGNARLPFVSVSNDGTIKRHPPTRYRKWPFEEDLIIVYGLHGRYIRYTYRKSNAAKQFLLESLIMKMNSLAERREASLVVANLESDETTKKKMMIFLKNNGIIGIACTLPYSADLRVKGDGHPNGKANTFYAECILDQLRNNLVDR